MDEIIEKYKNKEITEEEFFEEIIAKHNDKLKNILTYNDIACVEEAFKVVFQKSTDIITKSVRRGGTSCNVYVPKRFAGCPVTLIIWNREKFEEGTNSNEN